ncbi:uncharacterized protein LOC128362380 [Scomber japonicus]|uniref:uncharacterized protein LOC128362380 n=1 Tax=Scomber japonicus TaxID=13676 RepID=UPI002305FA5A|nr:uncharacterized protein LOC128362380 [Scomber japonicus]
MPRMKSFRRSQAARRRVEEQRIVMLGPQQPPCDTLARRGTGWRHKVRKWPTSELTGRQHKLVLPADAPDKKLVLLVGASHLRSFADGVVPMPEGSLSFAVMSTPGACAAQLRTEVLNATVPRVPDLVCLMAPSNNLTASRTVDEGRADFARLLCTVCTRWPKVLDSVVAAQREWRSTGAEKGWRVGRCGGEPGVKHQHLRAAQVIVMDFVPRLVVDEDLQAHFRNAFSQVAARMGVPYIHLADDFPTRRLELWSRDGIHLSDSAGMRILRESLWRAALLHLATPPPEPRVSPRTSPGTPRRLPRVVVKGEIVVPRQSDPFDWSLVERCRKRRRSSEEESCGAGRSGKLQQALEVSFPLNPVRFSSAVMEAMDRVAPSDLSSPEMCTAPAGKKKPRVDRQPKAATSKRRRARQQVKAVVEAAPVEVVVTQRETPAACVTESSLPSPVDVVVTQRETPAACVTESSPPSPMEEDFPRCVKGRTDFDSSSSGSVCSDTDVPTDHDDCTSAKVKWVRGSFHQGNGRFKYPGRQCMAIALASLAKHTVSSVFSWRRRDLDHVLHLGDDLYAFLRENNRIGGTSEFLCVPELPGQHVFDGQQFTFDYGSDYVSGVVNVVDGELVEAGCHTSLLNGLERMLDNYSTCLLTLGGNTCAVINQNGRYAVVDSHARSAAGLVGVYGRSIVAYFTCVRDLHEYVCNLAASLNASHEAFEIAGVRVFHVVFNDAPAADADVAVVSGDATADEVMSVIVSGEAPAADADVAVVSGDATADEVMSVIVSGEAPAADADVVSGEAPAADADVVSGEAPAADADVVFVSDEMCKQLQFDPLSKEVAQLVCKRVNVEFEKVDEVVSVGVGLLGSPCKKENIVADGNCFFRAVSLAVSGTQKSHRKIRLAVVKHLEKNASQYNSILRSEYSSVADYVRESKMSYVGSWATEVEIQAAADCLGVHIFTFCDGRWLEYSCKLNGLSRQGIYLENRNGNHYETVVCVHEPHERSSCYGLCKVNSSDSKVYNVRRRSVQSCSLERADCTGEDSSFSKYLMKKKKFQRKTEYQENVLFRQRMKEISIEKYRKNVLHRQRVKEISIGKYRDNVLHRERLKAKSVGKYKDNLLHREAVKAKSVGKYKDNLLHREAVKANSVGKYKDNLLHQERVKAKSVGKYRENVVHRQRVKEMSQRKYHGDSEHRIRVVEGNKLKMGDIKEKRKQFDFVMDQFLDKVKDGPDFVCSVCHRLLFRRQVVNCRKENYSKNKALASLADKCISEDYLHKCSKDCVVPCQWLDSARGQLWICHTCHSKLNNGVLPPESSVNNLKLDPIPPELACLNSLEQHLIALHIPFMKMLALPKGGQNGVHGPVTCVPANIVETSKLLPRSNMEGSLLLVKLKRKLTYKGHYEYQFVDTMRVRKALQFLKETNVYYKDVDFNEEWLNAFLREEDEAVVEPEVNVNAETGEDEDVSDELLHDRQQHCMFQDTCFMPVDIGQETLDQYYEGVLNVAPAEGNNPVKLLSDQENEAKCFPVLFPLGGKTYHDSRSSRLTLSRYLNNRILHADGRFSRNVEYIFFGQYMSEVQQVVSNVSIALRKGKGRPSKKVGGQSVKDLINDEESMKKLLEFDDGYRFLKPIRGTPAFWQEAQRGLVASVRQLGLPTWFCSFSSADLRWTNLLGSILKQEGRTQTAEDLEWADKCELLRRNPVTAARMFDYRWHVFLREVLMSPSNPIGKIVDFFYRVEFQQRGSPHVHCLFWIENAPKIDENTDEEVVEFIDKYVTCELPAQDETLLDIVTSVQQHSKRHSKTCKKKNTACRFNFPKVPSARTFISRSPSGEEAKNKCKCEESAACTCGKRDMKKPDLMKRDYAEDIVGRIKAAVLKEENSNLTVEELWQRLGISQATFEAAYKRIAKKTTVVLKRQVNEVWINQYSKPLLKCWNANLDVQFVVDAYACIVYIISYISKAERDIGLLLGNAQREASKDGNVSAKEALKSLGSVYLHNRDVSAQEAVYRLSGMHLKEFSRKVVFIPTGDNIVKMSLPISILREKAESSDCNVDDIWMTSIVDRYKNRPNDGTFNDMCIATFASEYRVLARNEKCKDKIQLKNDCGFVAKRTNTEPAVIRYARFSETKTPELFYQSILQLFLPYRSDKQLKPKKFDTYGQFYKDARVRFSDRTMHSVKDVVDLNRGKFEINADELDEILENIALDGVAEDAWGELCPEQEVERLECVQEEEERKKGQVLDGDDDDVDHENVPDLAVCREQVVNIEKRNNIMCRTDGLALIRSLNETQRCVFYQVRQWCLDRVRGKKPHPFHVFVTGGAGTGKSHLIKAIQYEAMRLLSTVCRQPDNICVLLTAPTGIAAYNLHGTTIHHTFSIGKDVRLPYVPLGEEKVNSLRAKYSDLQILIIDEISMVDHRLLTYVHSRLRQIKQSGDLAPFGNVCVIAVGDFFQLPPVRGKPLYEEELGVNLWSNLFKVVELTEVVRQKDGEFASLLNRVRTRSKGTAMLNSDIEILKRCETGEVSSALHIFPTNRQVNEHNDAELLKTCPEYEEIEAQDYVNDKKTGELVLKSGHHTKTYNTCLAQVLSLGKGARVMLCKNVDVSDGLVNGVCGFVTDIVHLDKKKFPHRVFVKFDDNNVGAQRRKQCASSLSVVAGSIGIEAEEERVTKKGGMRRQFPLRLAWACTVHKVQGITVDSAVVCLKKVFSAGQAYVALSRVRSLSGLVIQDFDDKAIYCKDNIKDAMQSMPQYLLGNNIRHKLDRNTFNVFLMNVQNLTKHVSDLASCTQHLQLNCIAVTETWLPAASTEAVNIEGFTFHSSPRSLSYNSDHPALIALQGQQHGGVGLYSADNLASNIITMPPFNLECIVYNWLEYNLLVAVIYRPPSYPMSLFKEHLGKLLDWLHPKSNNIAVMGDFNDDLLKSSSVCKLLTDKGFVQLVTQATTEQGTLIDHVYVNTSDYEVECEVVPAYFSDHEAIVCSFKCRDV